MPFHLVPASPSASVDFDLLSCDIYLDFLNRGASRDIDVTDWPGAEEPGTIFSFDKLIQLALPRLKVMKKKKKAIQEAEKK